MRCKGHVWSRPVLRHTLDPIKGHLHGYGRECQRFPCTKREEDFPRPCDCPRDANGVLLRVEVGTEVRVRQGVTLAGKRGRVTDRGFRPDGRTFWTVRLDIVTSTGCPDREYYTEELEPIA